MIPPIPWLHVIPELGLLSLALAGLAMDVWLPSSQSRRGPLILWIMIGGVTILLGWVLASSPPFEHAFLHSYVFDGLSAFFRSFFLLATLGVLLMLRESDTSSEKLPTAGALVLLAAIGMIMVASSGNLLTLFLAIEIVALCMYVLIVYLSGRSSAEAGLKYFILSGLSTGFFLFGAALVYGATGTIEWGQLMTTVGISSRPQLAQAGLWLIIAALGFRVAAVPFHLWAPDVFQGAPTPVAALLALGSHAAGMAALLRVMPVLTAVTPTNGPAMIAVLSGMSLLYGHLGAIPQTHLRRLLGYWSIGHTGYLLMALAGLSGAGALGIGYYLMASLLALVCAYMVMLVVERATGSEHMDGYAGLAQRSPLLAGSMCLALLSLVGVPPLAGFFAKFLVLSAAIERGFYGLALIGGLMVVVSLYYALALIRIMYVAPPPDNAQHPIALSATGHTVLAVAVAGMVLLGLVQNPFVEIASQLTK